MKPKDKTQVKRVYDFIKKHCSKQKTKSVEIFPNLRLKLRYELQVYGTEFDYEVFEETVTATKDMLKLFKTLGMEDNLEVLTNQLAHFDFLEIAELNDELDTLADAAELDSNDIYKYFNSSDVCDNTFEDLWEGLAEDFEDAIKPNKRILPLTRDYTAEIVKSKGIVQVGCQSVPIENIRKIVEAYDEL